MGSLTGVTVEPMTEVGRGLVRSLTLDEIANFVEDVPDGDATSSKA